MGSRVDGYRAELRELKRWEPYLKKHCGLPGPRANLELVAAFVVEMDRPLGSVSLEGEEVVAPVGVPGGLE